jgi:pimeloyl-ACP methyl ester carboxylesterase
MSETRVTFSVTRLFVMSTLSVMALSTAMAGDLQNPGKQPGGIVLSPCHVPDFEQAARCGVLDVSENPAKPNGRRLSISVAVIPALAQPALADPIVVLMGGPGEDAIPAAGLLAEQFAALRQDRDILLVDQRGTGQSGALPCAVYSPKDPAISLRDLFPPEAVKRCVQRLRAHADLTQYTYDRFASDLEQVRRTLGYGGLNLFAGSYGTRAAQVYIRAYPQSVRTVYLGSVVPLDAANPLPFAKTAQAAIEGLLSDCAADAACHAAFPNLSDEFRDISARLESGIVRVAVPGSGSGSGTAPLSRGRVAEWMRSKLYRPKSASILPRMIHRAYEGDWSPLVDALLSDAKASDGDLSLGLFFAITCNEDVAFIHEKDIAPATAGTFLGDYRVRQQQAACKEWPRVSLPAGYRTPVQSSVPVLFVSGDADGGTPLWYKEQVAPGFSNRVEVVAEGQGHTEWSDCISQLYQRLVRSGTVNGLDPSCEAVPRPPFKVR